MLNRSENENATVGSINRGKTLKKKEKLRGFESQPNAMSNQI